MKRWLLLLLPVFFLLIVLDVLFLDVEHASYWWQKIAGFDLGLGLVGSMAIILGAKALGKHLLQRPEGYYKKGDQQNND